VALKKAGEKMFGEVRAQGWLMFCRFLEFDVMFFAPVSAPPLLMTLELLLLLLLLLVVVLLWRPLMVSWPPFPVA